MSAAVTELRPESETVAHPTSEVEQLRVENARLRDENNDLRRGFKRVATVVEVIREDLLEEDDEVAHAALSIVAARIGQVRR